MTGVNLYNYTAIMWSSSYVGYVLYLSHGERGKGALYKVLKGRPCPEA